MLNRIIKISETAKNDEMLNEINEIIKNELISETLQCVMIKKLIVSLPEINLNLTSNHDLPLHMACKFKKIEIAKLLIENGANVNLAIEFKENKWAREIHQHYRGPLFFSVQYALCHPIHKEKLITLIEVLLAAGAHLNGNHFAPTLMLAAYLDYNLTKFFINKGVDLEQTDLFGNTLLLNLINSYAEIIENEKKTSIQFIVELLNLGANANHTNIQGETPLYLACYRNIPIVKQLIAAGANPNLKELNKCLFQVISHGNISNLISLLHRGASATYGLYYLVNFSYDIEEKTANKIFYLLLKNGANLNQLHILKKAVNFFSDTARERRFKIIQLMLENGASKTYPSDNNVKKLREYQFAHLREVISLIKNYANQPLTLKQTCIMHFFKNPTQLPADLKIIPEDVTLLIKDVNIELPHSHPYKTEYQECNIF